MAVFVGSDLSKDTQQSAFFYNSPPTVVNNLLKSDKKLIKV
jgi:hypothetical protein